MLKIDRPPGIEMIRVAEDYVDEWAFGVRFFHARDGVGIDYPERVPNGNASKFSFTPPYNRHSADGYQTSITVDECRGLADALTQLADQIEGKD